MMDKPDEFSVISCASPDIFGQIAQIATDTFGQHDFALVVRNRLLSSQSHLTFNFKPTWVKFLEREFKHTSSMLLTGTSDEEGFPDCSPFQGNIHGTYSFAATQIISEETVWGYLLVTANISDKLDGRHHHLLSNFTALSKNAIELTTRSLDATKSSRAKATFLANMSHEIRTPLHGILGCVDALSQSFLTEENREYIEAISSSGKNLLALLNDILDFSKLESEKYIFESHPCQIKHVVESVCKLHTAQAQGKGVQISKKFSSNLPDFVLADESKLRQVLNNLIGNAIKFSPAGEIIVGLESSTDHLVFKVSDEGIGIPKHALEQIFLPFSQADASTTKRFGGTGLGLTICRALVEGMGGSISIESRINMGTQITFNVPLLEAEAPQAERASSSIQCYSGIRVLVAEDNEVNQLVIRHKLNYLGVRFDLVSNGFEAINAIKKNEYQLVLMDCHMPQMDGYRSTRYIREKMNSDIVIVALSASTFDEDRQKAIDSGMNDFLSKPLNTQELIDVLNSVNESSTQEPPKVASKLLEHYCFDLNALAEGLEILEAQTKAISNELTIDADPMETLKLLHKLKGSMASFMCTRSTTLISLMESNIKNGKLLSEQDIQGLWSTVHEEIESIKNQPGDQN